MPLSLMPTESIIMCLASQVDRRLCDGDDLKGERERMRTGGRKWGRGKGELLGVVLDLS